MTFRPGTTQLSRCHFRKMIFFIFLLNIHSIRIEVAMPNPESRHQCPLKETSSHQMRELDLLCFEESQHPHRHLEISIVPRSPRRPQNAAFHGGHGGGRIKSASVTGTSSRAQDVRAKARSREPRLRSAAARPSSLSAWTALLHDHLSVNLLPFLTG